MKNPLCPEFPILPLLCVLFCSWCKLSKMLLRIQLHLWLGRLFPFNGKRCFFFCEGVKFPPLFFPETWDWPLPFQQAMPTVHLNPTNHLRLKQGLGQLLSVSLTGILIYILWVVQEQWMWLVGYAVLALHGYMRSWSPKVFDQVSAIQGNIAKQMH